VTIERRRLISKPGPVRLGKSLLNAERLLLFQVLRDVLAEPVGEGSTQADALLRRICLALTERSPFIAWAGYIVPDVQGPVFSAKFFAGLDAKALRIPAAAADLLWAVVRDKAPRVVAADDAKAPAWLRGLQDGVAEIALFPFGTALLPGVGLIGVSHPGYFARLGLDTLATFTNLGNVSLCLRAQALHDPLTGLSNRALFVDRLQHARGYARRRQRLLAVALLDLDGFKKINDQHGHAAGDALLRQVSQALQEVMRPADTVARIGGDEFALLFVDMSCLDAIEAVAARVLQALASVRPPSRDGRTEALSGSLGLTVFPLDEGDADTLLLHADLALYAAKAAGRGQYRVHSLDLGIARDAPLRAVERVRRALAQGRLRLDYQPMMQITGEMVGLEALLRLVSEDGEVVEAGALAAALDAPDVARPLGCFVLETVARQQEEWAHDARVAACQISLNISATHVLSPGFLDDVRALLAAHPGLDARALEFEVTESAALRDLRVVATTLRACRDLGARVALDDFGTGYSSLAHLQNLPIDTLKIDRSFVRDMAAHQKGYAVVAGITYMARLLGLRVTAEGVETAAHIRTLKALGCTVLQGYAIAPAMMAADVPEWMAAHALPPAREGGVLCQR
jgi:diguanylate cyclase (GGDEF)-like protein